MEMERSRVFKEAANEKDDIPQTGVRESEQDRERHRDGETEETGRQTDGVKRDRDGEKHSGQHTTSKERWKGSLVEMKQNREREK